MRKGFSTLKGKNLEVKEKEELKKAVAVEVSECVPFLLCYQAPEKDGGRIGIDAAGTRIIYHLLRFVPRLCTEVLGGIISKLTTEQLISICNDGLGSRCIIDGILEGPT